MKTLARAECYPDPTARAAGIHTGMTSYTPRMAYIRSTLQKILDFHMRNLVRSWEYATLDNRIWHPEPAYCTAQQHANTTLEPAPANAVNETLDLSASSRVMSLSAYVTEDEFEDDTEFGDAMMRLDVFEDFQTAKKWTIALRCLREHGDRYGHSECDGTLCDSAIAVHAAENLVVTAIPSILLMSQLVNPMMLLR